jgi:hypothetical protein
VFLADIYAFHRYTGNATRPYLSLVEQYRMQFTGLSTRNFTPDLPDRLRALYAQ